jgi:hypothetical protein
MVIASNKSKYRHAIKFGPCVSFFQSEAVRLSTGLKTLFPPMTVSPLWIMCDSMAVLQHESHKAFNPTLSRIKSLLRDGLGKTNRLFKGISMNEATDKLAFIE